MRNIKASQAERLAELENHMEMPARAMAAGQVVQR